MSENNSERRMVKLNLAEVKLEKLFDNNVLFLPGVIDAATSLSLVLDVLHAGITQDVKKEPLWVIISSPGGEISSGFAIYDTLMMIRESGREVYTVGLGEVASMAVCILQTGTKRFSFPNTQFTVHQASISGGEGGKREVNQFAEEAKELERVNKIVLTVISQRSGMDMKKLRTLSKKTDYSFDAKTAIEFGPLGLIDEVITCFPFMKPAQP